MIFSKVGNFNSIAASRGTESTNCVVEQTSVFGSINRCAGNWNAIAALNFNFAQLKLLVLERRVLKCSSARTFVSDHTNGKSWDRFVAKNSFFNKTVLSGQNDEAFV